MEIDQSNTTATRASEVAPQSVDQPAPGFQFAITPTIEFSSDPITSVNAPTTTPRSTVAKRKPAFLDSSIHRMTGNRVNKFNKFPKRSTAFAPPSSPPMIPDNTHTSTDGETIALLTKTVMDLTLEVRRLQRSVDKSSNTIKSDIEDLKTKIDSAFFLTANTTTKVEYLIACNAGNANKNTTQASTPAPPPLTATTKPPADGETTTPLTQQLTYADVMRINPTSDPTNRKPNSNRQEGEKRKPIPRANRTITIARETTAKPNTNPVELRDRLNEALREASAPPQAVISSVTLNAKNNLILLTRDDCQAGTVLAYQDALRKVLQKHDTVATTTIKAQETWYKVAVHGINLEKYPDDSRGMHLLKQEIETHNPTVKLCTTPRFITRPENRINKTESSVCICVNNESTANNITKTGLVILCDRKKTERYWTARPSDQCSNCQGFGHHWRRCNRPPTCRLCSANHKTRDHQCPNCPSAKGKQCPHTILSCTNCSGPHHASDRLCPTLQQARTPRGIPAVVEMDNDDDMAESDEL